MEAWHFNSAHAPLNRYDGGLLPEAYLHLFFWFCESINMGPVLQGSPLMKTLDRCVETLGYEQ